MCGCDEKHFPQICYEEQCSVGFPYPDYSLLTPMDVQLPHLVRRASEGSQEAKSRQQITACMISRAVEPCFLHICPFESQNKDKVSDFKFQERSLYLLSASGSCSVGTLHSYRDSKLSLAEQPSHLFPSEVLL